MDVLTYKAARASGREVGDKAARIAMMSTLGYRVPRGVVLPADSVGAACHSEAAAALVDACLCSLSIDRTPIDYVVAEAHERDLCWAAEQAIPSAYVETILTALEAQGLGAGNELIVRSSASAEDGRLMSAAGLFVSRRCSWNLVELKAALAAVWASQYSGRVLAYFQRKALSPAELSMSIVVQEALPFRYGGVLFSADPEGGAGLARADFAWGGPDRIVDGGAPDWIERAALGTPNADSRAAGLWDNIIPLRHAVQHEVDVEFGVDSEGDVVYLQVRPARLASVTVAPGIYTLDDVRLIGLEAFGSARVSRLLRARDVALREAAACAGLSSPVCRVVVASVADVIRGELEELSDVFSSRRVMVDVSETLAYWIVERDRLLHELESSMLLPAESIALVLTEFIEAEYGIAAQSIGDNVVIETCPGSCGGITRGVLSPSRVLVGDDGTVLSERISTDQRGWFYDPRSNRPTTRGGCRPILLSASQRAAIVAASRVLTASLGEGVILEAEGVGESIYLLGCSSSQLVEDFDVLTPGAIKGRAFVVQENEMLEHISKSFAVSVASREQRVEQLLDSILRRLAEERTLHPDEKIICIAKSPTGGLAYLFDHVDGFIFQEGSPLCHIAILLREHGIPASIVPDALEIYSDGSLIDLSPGSNLARAER